MVEALSFLTRGAVFLMELVWAGKELEARFVRKRAAAAYCLTVLVWAMADGWLLFFSGWTKRLPQGAALAVLLPSLADSVLFGTAVTLLFHREEDGKKKKMAAACFLCSASAGSVLLLLWALLSEYLSQAVMDAAVLAFCIAFFQSQRAAVTGLHRRWLEQKEIKRRLSDALLMQEETDFQEKQYREMEQIYEELRRLRHDMRNSFQLLHGLLAQGKAEEAMTWLEQENQALSGIPEIIRTQSALVDAVLNGKLELARRRGLSVSCKITASFSGIEERDLCRLLGNLLDNGIEAAVKTEQRTLDLVLEGDESRLLIELENAAARPLVLENGGARTDKGDSLRHGLGLRIMGQLAEKYGGVLRTENREGTVAVLIVLFRR